MGRQVLQPPNFTLDSRLKVVLSIVSLLGLALYLLSSHLDLLHLGNGHGHGGGADAFRVPARVAAPGTHPRLHR